MQVNFRVEARRCNLSHEFETQDERRSRRSCGLSRTSACLHKSHTVLGKGLNISPVTHIRCSTIESLRATAITPRFLPASLPFFARPHCRSAESFPQDPNT